MRLFIGYSTKEAKKIAEMFKKYLLETFTFIGDSELYIPESGTELAAIWTEKIKDKFKIAEGIMIFTSKYRWLFFKREALLENIDKNYLFDFISKLDEYVEDDVPISFIKDLISEVSARDDFSDVIVVDRIAVSNFFYKFEQKIKEEFKL